MEKAGTATDIADRSAVQDVESEYGIPVVSIADLTSLMSFLGESQDPNLQNFLPSVKAYRDRYGVSA